MGDTRPFSLQKAYATLLAQELRASVMPRAPDLGRQRVTISISSTPPPPKWTDITPAMAQHWLATRNKRNRPILPATVDAYARDMSANKWDDNGETMKFGVNEEGEIVLLDGQHRLAAIAQSGVTVKVLVVYGLPMSHQRTMDVGRKRLFRHQLGLEGEKNPSTLGSMLRRMTLWEVGCYMHGGSDLHPTESELRDTLAKYPNARDSAAYGSSNARSTGIHASLLGFCHWLLTEIDSHDGNWFLNRVSDGVIGEPGHAVLALRDRILRDNVARANGSRSVARLTPDEYIALVIYAWNAYRKGQRREKLQFPQGGLTNDNFPMPRK